MTVSARERSTCVSPDRATVYSFDREGRPLSWFERGRVYKRSLASDVHGRERIAGARRRFKLTRREAIERFEVIRECVARASTMGVDEEAAGRIEEILAWTPERLLDERTRFERAYRPVTILPPDQYLAVVLQATFGCSWGRCTFCDFYDEQPFEARTDPDSPSDDAPAESAPVEDAPAKAADAPAEAAPAADDIFQAGDDGCAIGPRRRFATASAQTYRVCP